MSVVPRSPVILSSIAKTENVKAWVILSCVMPMPTKLEKGESRNVLRSNTMQYFVSFGNVPGSSPLMDTTGIGHMISLASFKDTDINHTTKSFKCLCTGS